MLNGPASPDPSLTDLEGPVELVPDGVQLAVDEHALGRLGRGGGRDRVAGVDQVELFGDEGVGPRQVQAVDVRAGLVWCGVVWCIGDQVVWSVKV